MKKAAIILVGIFMVIGFLYGVYFIINPQGQPEEKIVFYKQEDKEKPKIELKNDFIDLGKMKVSEEKKGEFVIKNIGQKPLQLFNVNSSCGCTLGQVEIEGKLSELFGMHSRSDWIGEVKPGKTAKVYAIYRPFVMPVYGMVEREVYVSTNDPQNPKLVFKVKAIVN